MPMVGIMRHSRSTAERRKPPVDDLHSKPPAQAGGSKRGRCRTLATG
jgi:hypothetical protein